MKKFLLFLAGLAAVIILLVNLGPMVLLGISLWLLYIIFKKFIQSPSTSGKIGWAIIGLITFSIAFSNIYAVLGVAAAFALYYIYNSWKKDESDPFIIDMEDDDPFTNFEREWESLNK